MENRKIGTSIFRTLIGLVILKDFIIYFINRKYLFDKAGIVSYETYQDIISYYKLTFLYIDFTNINNVLIFCWLGIIVSIMFVLGIFPRISALILFILLLIFKYRNIYLMDGGDNIITAVLPLFIFINLKSHIKYYENFKQKIKLSGSIFIKEMNKLAILGIMLQVCIVYFFAGLHKLKGSVWIDGTALYYILNSQDFSASIINEYITKSPVLIYVMTWSTILFQLLFPILIWFSKTRLFIIALGILLHIGIFVLMRIDNFSFIMLSCYTVFISDNEYHNLSLLFKKYFKL